VTPRLRPSAAERWIACPGSVQLSEGLDGGSDSWYAAEGTHAHALAALKAEYAFNGIEMGEAYAEWEAYGLEQGFDLEEIEEHVNDYILYLEEQRELTTTMWFERQVETGVHDCAGTADAILIDGTQIHIVDLKYGKGVRVSVVENPQLRLYALGALRSADLLGIDVVSMTVFQPRLQNVSTETLAVEDLLAWRDTVAIPAADLTLLPEAPFNPGPEQCRWCPAAGQCQPRADMMLARERHLDAARLDDGSLAKIVEELEDVRTWCDQIEAEALTRANQGTLPGWKLVRSGGRRSITDGLAAIEALVAAGYDRDAVQRIQPETIGKLERLVGKKKLPDLIGDYITLSEGKKSLAPESDPRPDASDLAEDFADPAP